MYRFFRKYSCNLCCKSYITLEKLQKHKCCYCKFCNKIFGYYQRLFSHRCKPTQENKLKSRNLETNKIKEDLNLQEIKTVKKENGIKGRTLRSNKFHEINENKENKEESLIFQENDIIGKENKEIKSEGSKLKNNLKKRRNNFAIHELMITLR